MARWRGIAGGLAAAVLGGCGAVAARGSAPPASLPARIDVPAAIVTPDEVTTEAELAARGERALIEHRWKDAANAYRVLVSADPAGPRAPGYLFDLGLSLEGLEKRPAARDAYLDLATRFPDGPKARAALVRAATLDAYLEDWTALAAIGDALLARTDIEDVERLVALGARGLAHVEDGQLDPASAKDIYDGLDLADRFHYGDRDVLPVAVAQLRFALAELRRGRSERMLFDPLPPDYLDKLDERCAGLLEAQAAYTQVVRSVDPHWAAMAGYRVGDMYRRLHRDLMAIAPPSTSNSERQKQIFFAFMHIRYRVLLEKGLREIDQTVALAERTGDSSSWIARAHEAQVEMQTALADERAKIEQMPFTEAEVKAALDGLAARTNARPRVGDHDRDPTRPTIRTQQTPTSTGGPSTSVAASVHAAAPDAGP